jgi:hypothetical protein
MNCQLTCNVSRKLGLIFQFANMIFKALTVAIRKVTISPGVMEWHVIFFFMIAIIADIQHGDI